MSAIAEIAKDALGINGYQHTTEWARQHPLSKPRDSKAYVIFGGVVSGLNQVSIPLVHQQLETLFYGNDKNEPRVRNTILAGIIDIVGIGAIVGLASLNPQETLPIAVGGKVIYNAAASAIPKVVESAKTRFRPQRSA